VRSPFSGGSKRFNSARKRVTPEGEPLEYTGSSNKKKLIIPAIIGIIISIFIATSSVKIVDAGNRGILLAFGAVNTTLSLNEGIHFIVPLRDNIIQMEVRT
jgi:regulator of protease activity HflC (stomatin/prohibitin superfamily)